MATDLQIRQAIADQITDYFSAVSDIDRLGIHIEPLTFSAAEMPAIDTLHVSDAGLSTEVIAGFGDLRGPLQLNIRARVSPADEYAGEQLLSAFMDDEGELSILVALDTDHTLGGLAADIRWGSWVGVIPFPSPQGDGELIGSRLPLEVIKAHS